MEKGLKQMMMIAVMALMSFTSAFGQDVYSGSTSLVDIEREWENETLSGATEGTLIGMLECFNKRWPTWMVTYALKTMKKGLKLERYGEGLPTVFYDRQNGWVDSGSSAVGMEFLHSCYWKRSNGHLLLGIYLGKPADPNIHFVCFYDYSPTTHELTPEPHIIDGFRTTDDTKFYYNLPQHGKELTISEFGPRGSILHTFKWDGMKPVYWKSEAQDYADGDICSGAISK